MGHVLLSDIIGAPRPRTYLVRNGTIEVRSGIEEGLRDLIKSFAKRVVSKGTSAIRKIIGKKKPSEDQKSEPEPADKPTRSPTVSKVDRAEREADNAQKRSAQKDREAADTSKKGASKNEKSVAQKRRAAIRSAIDAKKTVKQKKKKVASSAAELAGDRRASSIKDPGKAGKVNAQLSHCILALHHKRGKDVRGAWNICRANLTKHGYLKGPYREAGKVGDLKQTQKGVRRAMQHAFEKKPLGGGIPGTPPEKFQKFSKLFRDIESTV